ncbi:acyl-ACP--UDP-N-acetylglucosamine O-acyltransferase [Coralliovum pocilloporae]|uniref:acyl-ACP--UDP-N-acetylglucosamine O-acyltransferase n=1 Tax=Coralliovum pocilloporae TaxID=3066369 RepID=UPI0033079E76
MADIHPSALVDEKAVVADDVTIGPFCVVGPGVSLGAGTRLYSHVVIEGQTSLGAGCTVFPFASIGLPPQDLKFAGEDSRVEIGDNVTIREHVTINPGTEGGGLLTQIGSNCLLMVGVHVAHDAMIGNHVILVNNATVAGHCEIGNHAILGGLCALHQFVRVGPHAFVGGMSGVEHDVIPYGSVIGNRAHLGGLNLVGLKRRGFPRESIHNLRQAYRELFSGDGTLRERVALLGADLASDPLVSEVVQFITSDSKRSFCTPRD